MVVRSVQQVYERCIHLCIAVSYRHLIYPRTVAYLENLDDRKNINSWDIPRTCHIPEDAYFVTLLKVLCNERIRISNLARCDVNLVFDYLD